MTDICPGSEQGEKRDKGDKENGSYDYLFKFIAVGNTGVGKSKIIDRFISNRFCFESTATIGVEFVVKTVTVDGKIIKLQIWDTAGQERYNSITKSYYRGISGALIIYDITDQASFDSVDKWIKDIITYAPGVPLIIIGNKSDCNHRREVSIEQAKIYCESKEGLTISLIETSALDGSNIEEAFLMLAKTICETTLPQKRLRFSDHVSTKTYTPPKGLVLHGNPTLPTPRKCANDEQEKTQNTNFDRNDRTNANDSEKDGIIRLECTKPINRHESCSC